MAGAACSQEAQRLKVIKLAWIVVVFFGAVTVIIDAVPVPTVTSVAPSFSPLYVETQLSVLGSGFANTELLSCRFGQSLEVPATFDSETHVTCHSPAVSLPGSTNLSVTVDKQWYSSGLEFEFSDNNSATTRGSTVMVLALMGVCCFVSAMITSRGPANDDLFP